MGVGLVRQEESRAEFPSQSLFPRSARRLLRARKGEPIDLDLLLLSLSYAYALPGYAFSDNPSRVNPSTPANPPAASR